MICLLRCGPNPRYLGLIIYPCFTVIVDEMVDERVSSLLDNLTKRWDIQKISYIFDDRALAAILNIQLGSIPRPCKWIWSR